MRSGTALVGLMGLLASIWAVGGCAAGPGGAEPATTRGGARPDAALRASDLYPPGERRFVELDPETRTPRAVEIIVNESPSGEGVWTQRVRTEGVDADDARERAGESVFARGADGGVSLRSLVARAPKASRDDDALYLFEPALQMVPGEMAIGERHEDECSLRIVELDDHDRVIQTGRAVRTFEVIGSSTMATRTGERHALRARAEMVMEMGAIRSVTTSTLWVEPGGGILVESFERVSRMMGVPVSRARGLKRAEAVEPAWDER